MSDSESIINEISINIQPSAVPIDGARTILSQLENCICQIYPKKGGKGTGFFCQIPFYNQTLFVLITNNHILKENDIQYNNIIELIIYDKREKRDKNIRIEIDSSRKTYTNPDMYITFIEIKKNDKNDNINEFLFLEEEILELEEGIIRNRFREKSIYLLHYPDNKFISYGLMTPNMSDCRTFLHYCNTQLGSSGSPILSLNSFKVIGVHCGSKYKYNIGAYIKYALYEFENKYRISLIYETDSEGIRNIFGEKFVKNNEDNIDIIINEIKTNLVPRYKLNKGTNKILINFKKNIYQ